MSGEGAGGGGRRGGAGEKFRDAGVLASMNLRRRGSRSSNTHELTTVRAARHSTSSPLADAVGLLSSPLFLDSSLCRDWIANGDAENYTSRVQRGGNDKIIRCSSMTIAWPEHHARRRRRAPPTRTPRANVPSFIVDEPRLHHLSAAPLAEEFVVRHIG